MTKIQEAKKIIEEADKVVIGAGAGLSAAAGLTYSGSRFQFFFLKIILLVMACRTCILQLFILLRLLKSAGAIGPNISIIIVTNRMDFHFIEIFSTW